MRVKLFGAAAVFFLKTSALEIEPVQTSLDFS